MFQFHRIEFWLSLKAISCNAPNEEDEFLEQGSFERLLIIVSVSNLCIYLQKIP